MSGCPCYWIYYTFLHFHCIYVCFFFFFFFFLANWLSWKSLLDHLIHMKRVYMYSFIKIVSDSFRATLGLWWNYFIIVIERSAILFWIWNTMFTISLYQSFLLIYFLFNFFSDYRIQIFFLDIVRGTQNNRFDATSSTATVYKEYMNIMEELTIITNWASTALCRWISTEILKFLFERNENH